MTELRHVVADLQQALTRVEKRLAGGTVPPAALEDFKSTLDGARTTLLAVLGAAKPADYGAAVRRYRLRRAAQACQGVLFGLLDGNVATDSPGLDSLRDRLTKALDRLDALPS